jgi:hypothetical protein
VRGPPPPLPKEAAEKMVTTCSVDQEVQEGRPYGRPRGRPLRAVRKASGRPQEGRQELPYGRPYGRSSGGSHEAMLESARSALPALRRRSGGDVSSFPWRGARLAEIGGGNGRPTGEPLLCARKMGPRDLGACKSDSPPRRAS